MRAPPQCACGWFVEGCPASRTVRTVTPARRPRFLPIIITGAVIGFLVGASLAVFGWFEDRDQPVSGLSLVLEGRTDEVAAGDRPAMDVARYGDRWAPVLVTFTSPQFVPRLEGRTVGLGRGVVTRDGPRGTIVSG